MSKTNFRNFILRKDATGSFEPLKKKSSAPEWFTDWVENKYEVDQKRIHENFEQQKNFNGVVTKYMEKQKNFNEVVTKYMDEHP